MAELRPVTINTFLHCPVSLSGLWLTMCSSLGSESMGQAAHLRRLQPGRACLLRDLLLPIPGPESEAA
jgi:hypothetical protein